MEINDFATVHFLRCSLRYCFGDIPTIFEKTVQNVVLELNPTATPIDSIEYMTHHVNVNYEKEFEDYLNREKHLALMVLNRAKKFGDSKIAVRHKAYGTWEAFTWKQFGDLIESAAKGLLSFGVKEFEFVGIFSNNRVEWAVVDYASFAVRACSVPVYATNSAKELEYIVNDCGIRILFVEKQEHYDKAMSILDSSKTLEKIVVFDRTTKIATDPRVMLFDDFIAMEKNLALMKHYRNVYQKFRAMISQLSFTLLAQLVNQKV